MQEDDYMKLAISLAQATKGQTSPNPQVGAVVVKDGCIVGTGVHLKAGEPHAEVAAIREAKKSAQGSDLYVTLEPCSHTGRTPPCVDAIIQAQIKRVLIATMDPNPLVRGSGIKKLKQAGIKVETGILAKGAMELNEVFFHYIQTGTPYVTMKAAVSIDGKIAAKTGDSKWITSNEARKDVHQLRHEHDAILVGIKTIMQDNPFLTTRLPRGGKNPIRVILDTNLRIPIDANVLNDSASKTIIYTGSEMNLVKAQSIQNDFVEVVPLHKNNIDIHDVLHDLGKREMMSILVEGGSRIHASFVETNAFQQVILYMAPKMIGGNGAFSFISGTGIEQVSEASELAFKKIEKIGEDLKLTMKPKRKE